MSDDNKVHYIGIDVGTGSARACVIDDQGNIVGLASQSIETWQPHPEFYEQSTTDIWNSICAAVKQIEETKTINATGHPVLQYVGGDMSVEMEMPKILWLKKHLDLRKPQGYLAPGTKYGEEGWQLDFLEQVGLEDLATDDYAQLGGINGRNGQYLSAGECVGPLSEKAAAELGLPPGIAVGSGVIDAYAGWVGTVGAKVDLGLDGPIDHKEHVSHRLALVAGTSTCHLAMADDELRPAATGELIRHVESYPAYSTTHTAATNAGVSLYDFLNDYLRKEAEQSELNHVSELAKHFFFYGDLWGNRSPLADPKMSGTIIGLRSDQSTKSLALHYYGALEFIALQTRQIVETMKDLDDFHVRVTDTQQPPEYVHAAVCHGAAMLAAMAASRVPGEKSKDLWSIMSQMSKPGRQVEPTTDTTEQRLPQAKYEVFLDMCFKQREYRSLVDERLSAAEY
ncbi:Carbohydrate kinase FGGY N-terminal [Penicillium canescens]|nr:Carbohydrate kinase FGGY N-terminal [Penicillium canescens]